MPTIVETAKVQEIQRQDLENSFEFTFELKSPIQGTLILRGIDGATALSVVQAVAAAAAAGDDVTVTIDIPAP